MEDQGYAPKAACKPLCSSFLKPIWTGGTLHFYTLSTNLISLLGSEL